MKPATLAFACIVLMLTLTPAYSDAPMPGYRATRRPPGGEQAIAAQLTIEASRQAKEARLIVPRSILERLRSESSGGTSGVTFDGGTSFSRSPWRTAIAGLSLSLACIVGGLFGLRSVRSLRGLMASALIAAAVAGLTVTIVRADVPLIPSTRTEDPGTLGQALSSLLPLSGGVRIIVVPTGDEIKLIVPSSKKSENN